MDNKNTGYGVINEIGDMGLGFTELNEQDQNLLKETEKEDNKND